MSDVIGTCFKNRAGDSVIVWSDTQTGYDIRYLNATLGSYTVFKDGTYHPDGTPHPKDILGMSQQPNISNVINDPDQGGLISTLAPPETKQTYSYSTEKYDEYADKYLLD